MFIDMNRKKLRTIKRNVFLEIIGFLCSIVAAAVHPFVLPSDTTSTY